MTVATSTIGGNEQFAGPREPTLPHLDPPAPDAVCGELGGVVVDTHADPPLIVEEIINAIGNDLAKGWVEKIMSRSGTTTSRRSPLFAGISKIPNKFLFLGVDGDRRLVAPQETTYAGADVFKLGIAVWMRRTFEGLPIGLQAVSLPDQQCRDSAWTDGVLLTRQFLGKPTRALASPTQGRFRVSTCPRLNQRLQGQ